MGENKRFNKVERETFRKRVNFLLVKNPNFKKNEIVHHFVKEGIARKTFYDTLNRLQSGQPLQDNKHTFVKHEKFQKKCRVLYFIIIEIFNF